jgi:hypothetical protein
VCVAGLAAAAKPSTLAHVQVHNIVAVWTLLEPEETNSHPHVRAH